jgi:GGDEF domain-containing protein
MELLPTVDYVYTRVLRDSRRTMISIKRFLDQGNHVAAPQHDTVEALTQMVRLLLEAMGTHTIRGNEADLKSLRRTLAGLVRQLEEPLPAMTLLGISSDAVDAFEDYCQRTGERLREQHVERQSMIAMLADTVAELSGQADTSVARLQAIEKQVESASLVDDMRTLRSNLADSLRALRDAAAAQKSSSMATVARLEGQVKIARSRIPEDPEPQSTDPGSIDHLQDVVDTPAEPLPTSYVAVFKLQRAEYIASRFGDAAKSQMFLVLAAQLKTVLGPNDRLLRWKGTSFVMFINSTESIKHIKNRLTEVIAATGQQYIEVGRKSALLSVGVDWNIFPQAGRASLEAVFTEVDAFLANVGQTSSTAIPHDD